MAIVGIRYPIDLEGFIIAAQMPEQASLSMSNSEREESVAVTALGANDVIPIYVAIHHHHLQLYLPGLAYLQA